MVLACRATMVAVWRNEARMTTDELDPRASDQVERPEKPVVSPEAARPVSDFTQQHLSP
jgi:hypothetical protein